MKKIIFMAVVCSTALFSGCITDGAGKNGDRVNKPEIYKLDLDNDGIKEITKVEKSTEPDKKSVITISSLRREEIDSFSVGGKLNKVDFIDLNEDGFKQIAVFSRDTQEKYNLAIYKMKNNQLFRLFSIASSCGIDTDFSTVLSRIRVCKSGCEGEYYANNIINWEVWVWSGERFIREVQ
ncbi:MAG: hypothetical protein ABIH18_08710 [Candidatus Omnitrophota bacterium]